MTADFSDLWIMKGLGQLQPGRVTLKYFRHPTERRNNKSTHGPMRPSVLLCLIKHNLKCTHFFVKELTLNYTTITVEYRTHGSISILFYDIVADLFNNGRWSKAGRECVSANGDRIKVHFMKEYIIHFNGTIWKVTVLSFLLLLLLIYMCDFLEKKESPLRVISNLHSCFVIIPPEILQTHFFFLLMIWQPSRCPTVSLTRFVHFSFSLRSLNEQGLQGGVHAKCLKASKLIRNKKACGASG